MAKWTDTGERLSPLLKIKFRSRGPGVEYPDKGSGRRSAEGKRNNANSGLSNG